GSVVPRPEPRNVTVCQRKRCKMPLSKMGLKSQPPQQPRPTKIWVKVTTAIRGLQARHGE
ncbi:MAG: hypothetical protein JXQ75_20830, partial [Phycisphaerae bacterium]|nr:hypothetical protein [Phycisphaerae bacterium]